MVPAVLATSGVSAHACSHHRDSLAHSANVYRCQAKEETPHLYDGRIRWCLTAARVNAYRRQSHLGYQPAKSRSIQYRLPAQASASRLGTATTPEALFRKLRDSLSNPSARICTPWTEIPCENNPSHGVLRRLSNILYRYTPTV